MPAKKATAPKPEQNDNQLEKRVADLELRLAALETRLTDSLVKSANDIRTIYGLQPVAAALDAAAKRIKQ